MQNFDLAKRIQINLHSSFSKPDKQGSLILVKNLQFTELLLIFARKRGNSKC